MANDAFITSILRSWRATMRDFAEIFRRAKVGAAKNAGSGGSTGSSFENPLHDNELSRVSRGTPEKTLRVPGVPEATPSLPRRTETPLPDPIGTPGTPTQKQGVPGNDAENDYIVQWLNRSGTRGTPGTRENSNNLKISEAEAGSEFVTETAKPRGSDYGIDIGAELGAAAARLRTLGCPADEVSERARDLVAGMLRNDPRLTEPQTDPSRCHVCGERDAPHRPFIPVLTPSLGAHHWLHRDCLIKHRRRIAEKVEAMMAAEADERQ
jgi:hypothetical protein